jgi:hypothetical protein
MTAEQRRRALLILFWGTAWIGAVLSLLMAFADFVPAARPGACALGAAGAVIALVTGVLYLRRARSGWKFHVVIPVLAACGALAVSFRVLLRIL